MINKNSKLLIVGCGGLGSNVAVYLVRAGFNKLTIVDFDFISESNLAKFEEKIVKRE